VKQNPKQDQCTVNERNGQLVFALNNEILLPENAPVRLTSAQLEELDYRKLYRAYSARGRKSKVDPRVLFKVMAYGYQCGIYSSRKLEEACRYRVDFMCLLEEEPVPDHTTLARFRTGRCTEAVEDLFYQYVALLERQGETDHETVFVVDHHGGEEEAHLGQVLPNLEPTGPM
jgi:transposase